MNVVDFSPHPELNVIVGANGAGKTSVLEAIFFLGRGRSFRSGQAARLIQSGAASFTVFGETGTVETPQRLGLRYGASGAEIHVDGQAASVSELAAFLPVQVIDPLVHELVQGGPQARRRFLDWGVFHVKHGFLGAWRRYRRALQQRNLALRQGSDTDSVTAWNQELSLAGGQIDAGRRAYLAALEPYLDEFAQRLMGVGARADYAPGWAVDQSLAQALAASWDRDQSAGRTHVGPHRAELHLIVDERPARHRLSRGQQKLLGAAMVLAQSEYVAAAASRPVVLLIDEPAAELDSAHLANLMATLTGASGQLFITAVDAAALPLEKPRHVFHVERGELAILI